MCNILAILLSMNHRFTLVLSSLSAIFLIKNLSVLKGENAVISISMADLISFMLENGNDFKVSK